MGADDSFLPAVLGGSVVVGDMTDIKRPESIGQAHRIMIQMQARIAEVEGKLEESLNYAMTEGAKLEARIEELTAENDLSIIAMTRANEMVKTQQARIDELEAKHRGLMNWAEGAKLDNEGLVLQNVRLQARIKSLKGENESISETCDAYITEATELQDCIDELEANTNVLREDLIEAMEWNWIDGDVPEGIWKRLAKTAGIYHLQEPKS